MNLFFLRHARPEPRGPVCARDPWRPLNAEGEQVARQVAQGMAELKLEFDLILTSPYVRASKTAEITATVLKAPPPRSSLNLEEEGDPAKLIAEIKEIGAKFDNILLVGHDPYLSELISVLLTGSSSLKISFKKSALAKLSIEDLRYGKCATLEWLLAPRQLQKLAKQT